MLLWTKFFQKIFLFVQHATFPRPNDPLASAEGNIEFKVVTLCTKVRFFHNMNLASVRIPLKINDSLVYSRMRNLSIVLGEFYLHSIMHNALDFEYSRLYVVCTLYVFSFTYVASSKQGKIQIKWLLANTYILNFWSV